MDRVSAENRRNESLIEFVSDDAASHATAADFYAAVVRLLSDGWSAAVDTERYIRDAVPTARSREELERRVAENLEITPVPSFRPDLSDATAIHSFRDDWNVQEFVWAAGGRYHFMGWSTST